jgi:hypothetical protein
MNAEEVIVDPSISYDLSMSALKDGIDRFSDNFNTIPSIILCSIEDKFLAWELTRGGFIKVVASSAINRGFFLLVGGPGVFCNNTYDEDKIRHSTITPVPRGI